MDSHRERVERRAYELWERDGRPDGQHHRHWEDAERQVTAEERGDQAGRFVPEPGTLSADLSHSVEDARPAAETALAAPSGKPRETAKATPQAPPRQPAAAPVPPPAAARAPRKGAAAKRETVT